LFYLFTNNKNLLGASKFLKMLKLKNFNLSVLADITYHQSITHRLHVNNFTTVVSLPPVMSPYSLSLPPPISVTASNFVSNLFFLHMLLKLKTLGTHPLFNKREPNWASLFVSYVKYYIAPSVYSD